MTAALRRYRGDDADNRRWDGIALRPGDVVVCAPSKSGTTWTQLLVALLVFDGELPAPLGELSPWVDMRTEPLDALAARLAAMDHRRILKTHTPLDGVPVVDGATYLHVTRDPRDVAVSMGHHRANMDRARLARLLAEAAGQADRTDADGDGAGAGDGNGASSASGPPIEVDGSTPVGPSVPEDDDAGRLARWIDRDTPAGSAGEDLDALVHHLAVAWPRRWQGDVELLHFADLVADPVGELRRLALVLGIDLAPDRVAELAALATLDQARSRAVDVAPMATQGLWRDPAAFFRAGRVGEWREVFTPDLAARYDARLAQLTDDPALVAWLHHGSAG